MSYTVDRMPNGVALIVEPRENAPTEVVALVSKGAPAHMLAAAPELLEAAEAALAVLKSCCEKAWRDEADSVCSGECRHCDVHAAKEKLEAVISRAKGGDVAWARRCR